MGGGTGNPYKFPNDTATYVVSWVVGAKKYYNLDIDYIGVGIEGGKYYEKYVFMHVSYRVRY